MPGFDASEYHTLAGAGSIFTTWSRGCANLLGWLALVLSSGTYTRLPDAAWKGGRNCAWRSRIVDAEARQPPESQRMEGPSPSWLRKSHSARFVDQTGVLSDNRSIPVKVDDPLKPRGVVGIRSASPRGLISHSGRRKRWLDVNI
jgi:hypothetical protein